MASVEEEIKKIISKGLTSKQDAECLQLLISIYKEANCMINEDIYSVKKSKHSMADKEIAMLEARINNASSEYERKFYESLIRAAKEFNE